MTIRHIYILIGVVLGLLCVSCANRGTGPQGGPRDTIPPMVVKESPMNGSLNFGKKDKSIAIAARMAVTVRRRVAFICFIVDLF